MEDARHVGSIAALTDGIPAAPGLGPIAERLRGQGLHILEPDHARLLAFLAAERGMLRAFVAGRSAAHAAACVAHVAPEALILMAAPEALGDLWITSTGASDRVRVVAEEATQGLGQGEEVFDLIHLDEEVSRYRLLLDLALTRASVRGIILLHGLQTEGSGAEAVRAFCGYLLMHPQLQATVVGAGSGLAIARKIQPLVTDLGGPF
jgi:predicted O-methyltransferase YrrM